MAEEVGMAIAPMIIEPLMKRVIRHVLYAFNFNKIVEELKQEIADLKMTRDRVAHDVDRAKSNAEEIEKDVSTWQMDVEKIIAEEVRLEEDISKNKSCINGLCPNLFGRYRFGKQAMKKKDAVTKLREKGNFSRVSYFPDDNLPGIKFYETKDFMPSASARLAFNLIMKEFKDGKKIIALYGMGGVGKTTLAVEVGKKAKELKLVDEVIMAVVSQNPSAEKIQGQIADMIGLRFEESSSMGKANRLRLRLEKMEKKILIVLDDVWQKLDLASIGIPSSEDCANSKVLLTTRRQQVCDSMGSQCNIPLDVLTDEEAWALFGKRGGLSNDSSPLTLVAKSIADECKGLPLAIVAVASALKGKSPSEWEVALQRLRRSRYVGIPDADQDVYKCIRFSYDYLQDKEARLCFMLSSLFPEDHNIEVEVLVRYAYGLGLCEDVVDSIDGVRTELHVVITSLKASSLLLSGSNKYGRESDEFVKMHDIVRDVALWISSGDENNASMVRAGMELKEWPKNIHNQMLSRISLMKNRIAEHCSGLVCPRLNLLLLDDNGCYKFPNDFFDGMKELQVLSVCNRPTFGSPPYISFPLPQSIQLLTNLRTLRIEWLRLNDISVLGKLKGLEILSLRGSHLEELPSTIGELNGLRVLDLSDCNSNMRIPDKLLRKLSKLEELYIEILERDEGSCYAILCDLMALPKLSFLSLKTDNIHSLGEDICFPKHLVRYCIIIGPESSDSYFYKPGSKELRLKNIDVAKLNVFKEIIPGVNSLSLRDIEDDCILNIVPAVDQSGLRELTSLRLDNCHNMKCLLDTTDHERKTTTTAFSKLDSIDLHGMNSLKELICGLPADGLFKELRELKVCACHSLCTIVRAKLLPNLKKVKVQFCEKVKELFEVDLILTDVRENELLLSNLESLRLCCLPELTRIWKGPTIEVVSLVNLRELVVEGCPKLTSLLSLSLAQCLVQLQELRISECNELKQIFYADDRQANGHEPTVWFPQLRQLLLAKLPKLISIWHENYIRTLPVMPCLEELYVEGCPNMGTQFIAALRVFEKKLEALEVEGPNWSSSCNTILEQLIKGSRVSLNYLRIKNVGLLRPLIPGLVKVETILTIRGCKGVEEILEVGGEQSTISWKRLTLEDLPDLACIWRGPSQLLIFHNLESLSVIGCHGLKKHLLTTSIARSLLQLSTLVVRYCKELEQIFGDDETDNTTEIIVTLPRLSRLSLYQLPNLISFCPSTYHFIFPSLRVLTVNSCPNNHTGFSRKATGRKATGRYTTELHAKGEALCNRGKCNDVNGTASLPLYEEDAVAQTSNECLRRGSNNA